MKATNEKCEVIVDNVTYVRKDIAVLNIAESDVEDRSVYEDIVNKHFINQYVIVRCRDAGVHAGILLANHGRECVLKDSRRLWYYKPADGQKFLSGLAVNGANSESKFSVQVAFILLTEDCEIIKCTTRAEESIKSQKVDEN